MRLINAETVAFTFVTEELDDLGEPVGTGSEVVECEAVVAPGSTSELDASRPNGCKVSYTIHMPKTWERSLRGATVEVRGKSYRVVGDPQPYTAANVPGAYGMPVEVEAVDG